MNMKRVLLFVLMNALVTTAAAQTWNVFQTPLSQTSGYELYADYSGERFVLISDESPDTVYTKTGNNDWTSVQYGRFVFAFYTDNGTLFLVENVDAGSGFTPKVFRSTDNGATLDEISGVAGGTKSFQRDYNNNVFLTTSTGFKYSTDNGATFTDVTTDSAASSATMNEQSHLYYGTSSGSVFKSTDGGSTWNIVPIPANSAGFESIGFLQVKDSRMHFEIENDGFSFFALESDTAWTNVWLGITANTLASQLYFAPDGSYYMNSPYGLFNGNTWNQWSFVYDGFANSGTNGYYAVNYAYNDTAVYIKTSSDFFYSPHATSTGILQPDAVSITVAPNPTTGKIRIQRSNESPVSIDVYNAIGALVETIYVDKPSFDVDLSHQPVGMYLLKVTQGNGSIATQKIIKH